MNTIQLSTVIPINEITSSKINANTILKNKQVIDFQKAINKSYFNSVKNIVDNDPKIRKHGSSFQLDFQLRDKSLTTDFPHLSYIGAWSHYNFTNCLLVNWLDDSYSSIIGRKLVPVNYKIIINSLSGLSDKYVKFSKYYFECLPIFNPLDTYY